MKYLNKQIKEDVIIIDVLCNYMSEALARWEQAKSMQGEKKFIQRIKQSRTLIYNNLSEFLAQFTPEEVLQVMNKKSQNEIFILPKSDIKMKTETEVTKKYITGEQAMEISEGIIEGFCKKCTCKDFIQCTKRGLMLEWLIPGLEETEGCQYKY
jgi:hypothetical protein